MNLSLTPEQNLRKHSLWIMYGWNCLGGIDNMKNPLVYHS